MITINLQWIMDNLNYKEIVQNMNDMAKTEFGYDLQISTEDQNVKRLVAWILRLEKQADELEIDLNKGLLVAGNGSRKNRMMEVIRCFTFSPHYNYPFEIITSSYISNAFTAKGAVTIEEYIGTQKAYCFTELGKENYSQFFSVKCYVMDQILHNRCQLQFRKSAFTHVTTSLFSEEIEARYGKAMRECLKENFNRVVITDTP